MRKLFYIENLRRNLFVFLGLFIAVFIVSQEVIEYQCNLICQELIEEDEQSSEDEAFKFSIASDALIPVFGIELEPYRAILLAELVNELEAEVPSVEEVPLYNSPHFKTLFRQIQSPNAPSLSPIQILP